MCHVGPLNASPTMLRMNPPRRLVWSEVRDLLDIAVRETVDDLIEAQRVHPTTPPPRET